MSIKRSSILYHQLTSCNCCDLTDPQQLLIPHFVLGGCNSCDLPLYMCLPIVSCSNSISLQAVKSLVTCCLYHGMWQHAKWLVLIYKLHNYNFTTFWHLWLCFLWLLPFDVMHHLVIPSWDVCSAAIYLVVLGSFTYCNAVHNLVCSPKVDHELRQKSYAVACSPHHIPDHRSPVFPWLSMLG